MKIIENRVKKKNSQQIFPKFYNFLFWTSICITNLFIYFPIQLPLPRKIISWGGQATKHYEIDKKKLIQVYRNVLKWRNTIAKLIESYSY